MEMNPWKFGQKQSTSRSQIHTPNHNSPNFSDSHIRKLCKNYGVAWMGLNLYDYHSFLEVRLCAYIYAIQCTYDPTKCQKLIFKSKHNKENSQYFVNKLYLTKLVLKKRNKQIISEPNAFIKIDRYPEKKCLKSYRWTYNQSSSHIFLVWTFL